MAAMRKAASRWGLTSKAHSLHHALSIEDEEGLTALCSKHTQRGTPLSVPDLIELESKYKGFAETDQISRHFVSGFVRRHKDTLGCKPGKVTSPKRSSDVMDKETEKFIAQVTPLFERKAINKNNLFVCDETMIGDPEVTQQRVGKHRNSGGGNFTLFEKRGKVLGCFLPFSRCDGSTPFRVFVSKEKEKKKNCDFRSTVWSCS